MCTRMLYPATLLNSPLMGVFRLPTYKTWCLQIETALPLLSMWMSFLSCLASLAWQNLSMMLTDVPREDIFPCSSSWGTVQPFPIKPDVTS